MDYDAQIAIQPELASGERILWAGRPAQGIQFRTSDILFAPFSLLWAGFAVFWEWNVIRMHAPFFFELWGLPFIAAGIYIVVGRFFFDASRRAKTFYAVTNERVVTLTKGRSTKLKSVNLRSMGAFTLRQGQGTRGTISFGEPSFPFASVYEGLANIPSVARRLPPVFEMIEDAKGVFERVLNAQRNLKSVGA